jgi:uncharacterized protein YoxC
MIYWYNLLNNKAVKMDPITMTLMIVGIIVLVIFGIALLYSLVLMRRANIVMKKADYLIEDLTYKSESLSVGVEAIQQVSNYILSLDAITKKGLKSLTALLAQNKNFLYQLLNKVRTEDVVTVKKTTAKKSQNKKTVVKKKTTTKKTK